MKKPDQATLTQTSRVALGVAILVALMLIVYAILGRLDSGVIFGLYRLVFSQLNYDKLVRLGLPGLKNEVLARMEDGTTAKKVVSIIGGLLSSFSIGALFAVAYSVPAQLAAEEEKRTGISNSAMYFAVQGLFSGVASGIGGQAVLTFMKTQDIVLYMTLVCALAMLVSFALTFLLPKSVQNMGKE